MDLTILLFINILIAAIFAGLSIWGTGYAMRWWLRTQRVQFAINDWFKKMTYLEIKLPREIHKSPAAMEVLLNTLLQPSGHNQDVNFLRKRKDDESKFKHKTEMRKKFYDTYLKGKLRLWHSLEIVSEEGQIRYFIVMAQKFVDIFKSYAYSQFPGIEIYEVEDYLDKYNYTNQKTGDSQIYLTNWKMAEDDSLPIKTYVDYGLDRDPKEEFKIDPLTPLLETFAAAGPGETFVFQLLVRPSLFEKEWRDATKKKMKEVLDGEKKEDEKEAEEEKRKERRQMSHLFPHEKSLIEAMQKNIEKPAFDVIARSCYIAHDRNKYSVSKGMLGVLNSMKSFNKPGYNSFSPKTITPYDDYPFTDPKGLQTESNRGYYWFVMKLRTGFYYEADANEFAWRKFFYKWFVAKNYEWAMGHIEDMKAFLTPGYHKEKGDAGEFILSTEELATIWHFPGTTFGNTSARVSSVKSEAPRNLPI